MSVNSGIDSQQDPLDPLFQGHLSHPAALTAAAELQVGDGAIDRDQFRPTAVGSNRRVDGLGQNLGHLIGQRAFEAPLGSGHGRDWQ